jgi:2-phosphoglycolate phosphatase
VPAHFPREFGAVVFDLDGTLLDSYAAIHDSLNATLRALGLPPVPLEETRRRVGRGLEALMAESVGTERKDEGVRIFRDHYEKAGPESTRLLPGADEVTRALAARGTKLAVASNKPARFSRQLLDHFGISSRFGAVFGPDDGFPPKPAPHMVFMALALVGVKAADALYVGDMPIDVLTARAAGVTVAVVPTGSSTREELRDAGPDALLDDVASVMHLFP